jgi:sporulation protein YlmC with PRC-barrel domain
MFIRRKTHEVVLVGLVCAISLTSARGQTHSSHPLTAHRLIGMKVEDRDGQNTGKLWDLVFDTQHGRLRYAIIASGGLLGIRPQLRAMPPELVTASTAKRDTLGLTVIKAEFERAPTITRPEIAMLHRSERMAQFERLYGRSPPEKQLAAARGNSIGTGTGVTLPPTGGGTGSSTGPLKLASDIIGQRVVNRQREKLGEVLDLLLDFSSDTPVIAIVPAGKLFRDRDDKYAKYAIPLRALRPTDEADQWMIDATRASLEQARPFDPQSRGSDTTIYRYEETERGARRGAR